MGPALPTHLRTEIRWLRAMTEVIDPKLAAALAHFFVAMAFDDFGFLLVKLSKL